MKPKSFSLEKKSSQKKDNDLIKEAKETIKETKRLYQLK